jgi:hypothetical protein
MYDLTCNSLSGLSTILSAVAAIRLFRNKHLRVRFRWLLILLIYGVMRDLFLITPIVTHRNVASLWALTGIPESLLFSLTVFFACRDLIELYRGSEGFGTKLAASGCGAALIYFAGVGAWSTNDIDNAASITWIGALFEDAAAAAATASIISFLAVYLYFPRPLKRMPTNIVWNLSLLGLYGLAMTSELLLMDCVPMWVGGGLELAALVAFNLTCVGWIFGMRESGEVGLRWNLKTATTTLGTKPPMPQVSVSHQVISPGKVLRGEAHLLNHNAELMAEPAMRGGVLGLQDLEDGYRMTLRATRTDGGTVNRIETRDVSEEKWGVECQR